MVFEDYDSVGKELEVHLQVVAFHVICPFCIKIFKN